MKKTELTYIFHETTQWIEAIPLLGSNLESATNFIVHKAQLSDANYMATLCKMENLLRCCSISFNHVVINFDFPKDRSAFHP